MSIYGLMILATMLSVAGGPNEALMEQRATAFVSAFNSGDPGQYATFGRDNRHRHAPPDDWREHYLRLFERLGRLEIVGVGIDGDALSIMARADKADGDLVEITFTFAGDEDKIDGIQFAIAGRDRSRVKLPSLDITPDMDKDELTRALDAYLGDLARRDVFSGTALVVRDGKVLYQNAFGLASRSFDVANRVDTRFRVGSITKDFTDIVVARLIADGRLHPNTTVAELLPDYPNQDAARRITINHLLNHTSGLGNFDYAEFLRRSPVRYRGPADYLELFANQPLAFEPGTGETYSNAGYIVLGVVIEAITGKSYFDAVREYVFEPAGMTASNFYSLDRPHPGVAVGYWKDRGEGEWLNNYYRMEIDGGPSGGSYSTAMDLWRFDHSLRTGKLLPPEETQWFLTRDWPHPGEIDPTILTEPRGSAGGAEGVNAVYFSGGDWFVCVLCNLDGSIAEEVGRRIFQTVSPR